MYISLRGPSCSTPSWPGPRSYDIATRKAATVVATKLTTADYGAQLKSKAVAEVPNGITFAGGVPIVGPSSLASAARERRAGEPKERKGEERKDIGPTETAVHDDVPYVVGIVPAGDRRAGRPGEGFLFASRAATDTERRTRVVSGRDDGLALGGVTKREFW